MISQGVARSYWYTLSLASPTTNMFRPSAEKATPVGMASWDPLNEYELPSVWDAEVTFQGVELEYWCTLSLLAPDHEHTGAVRREGDAGEDLPAWNRR